MTRIAKISVIFITLLSHFSDIRIHYAIVYNVLMLLLITLIFVQFWKSKENPEINIPEILVSVFALYLLINNVLQGSFIGNNNLYRYLTILLLYFGFKILFQNDKNILQYFFYAILASLSIEVLISFGQIFGLVQNSDGKFIIGGLFGNPGALAGFLSIVIPFLLVIILNYKDMFQMENFYYAIIFGFSCSVFLIIYSNSRGAWIASFVGMGLAINHRYKENGTRNNWNEYQL